MATTRLTGTLIKSGSIPVTALGGGVVTSSAQIAGLVPGGTVSSSAQYPGWVTASSQIDYNSITNKLSGVVSSSTQVQPLLPGGTVSASGQVDITATTNYSTFSSSIATKNDVQDVSIDALNAATSSYAINSTIQSQLAGVASSSSQVKEYLPTNTVSSSTQVTAFLPVDTVSSSTQVVAFLPANTVSGSSQIDITATTNYPTFSSSIATKNDTQDISISALNAATSSYALQTQLAGVASSSAQVKTYLPTDTVSSSTQVVAFLPTDTVSSSAQYPGWVTSSTQITQALPTGTVSSSAQYPGWVTASSQIDYNSIQNKLSGVLSSSEQVQPLLPANTVSSSTQVINNIQNQTISPTTVYAVTIDATTISGSTVSGSFVGDGSGLTNIGAAGLPGGVVSASSQYPGWVTASSQIDYNSIQNKLSGVVSSSTQVQPLLPGGTVSSSGQVDITTTSGYSTFSSSLSTVDTNQQTEIDALKAVTSSYAINSTIQSQLANVVSSSTQIKPLLPGGTVSSSVQYPGWVTASSQIDITATTNYSTFSSSLATVDATQQVSIDALNAATSSYAINATIQSQLANVVSSSTQVQPLLPGGTVSSSGQVDITATTNYSTFSSSIATKNDTQDISIGALNAATSSYAINATIQSQLAGVASSSSQVKAYLPDGSVSASGQVDITATTGYSTFSSSLATVDAGQTARIDNLASATSSYALQSQLAGVASSSAQVKTYLPDGTVSSSVQVDYNSITNKLSGVVSSSAQVQPLLPAGTLSSSTQVNAILDADGVFSSSAQVVVQNTTGIGALATTGSNTFTADQVITGSLFISQNLNVLGSSSISYISQSTLNIGTNVITMNTNTPGTRFGGIEVIDSGSSPLRSGSLFFDSINDQWMFIHQNTAGGLTSSVLLMGPATFNDVGNETLLTQNRLLKAAGLEHVTDSQITDNGITVSITNGLSVGTNVSASGVNVSGLTASQIVSTDANKNLTSTATTGTGNVVLAGSPTITGTLNATNITATGTMLLAGIYSSSAQVDYNNIQNKLSGVVSSSGQVQPLLPGGTVSSSAQYPGWVTASSQIDYNSITNKLSGVVSSSAQVKPLLPDGTVSASGQVDITATTGYSTFSSSLSTVDAIQQISLNALNAATSSYAINSTIQSQLAGVISSSAQTVSSIANQTIAPLTVNATNVTASSLTANQAVFTNASDGLVSNAITGTGNVVMSAGPTFSGTITAASITATGTMLLAGIVSQSSQIDYNSITNKLSGVYSSSALTAPSQGTVRLSFNGVALSDLDTGLQTGDGPTFAGMVSTAIISGSGVSYRLVVPVGTNYYAT